ncbi:hypothetical protein ACQUZK_09750, partial [Streptococcus pyogenes]|uniref:hypothetical protein n=1 Tax=Streptococcus pyogenes TaxID=1314 RepID=UPI003DA0F8E7
IHTLYDLHLISVDERLRIHLSKTLRRSEYGHLDGKPLTVLPDSFRDQPSSFGLSSRHARFISAEEKRA